MFGPYVLSESFVTPWTITHEVPLSLEFLRQEYWNGLPFPPPGVLPYPGFEPSSLVSPGIGKWNLYHKRHLGVPQRPRY